MGLLEPAAADLARDGRHRRDPADAPQRGASWRIRSPAGPEGPNNWQVIGVSRDQWKLLAELAGARRQRPRRPRGQPLPAERRDGPLERRADREGRQMAEDVGRRAATVAEAREMLGLGERGARSEEQVAAGDEWCTARPTRPSIAPGWSGRGRRRTCGRTESSSPAETVCRLDDARERRATPSGPIPRRCSSARSRPATCSGSSPWRAGGGSASPPTRTTPSAARGRADHPRRRCVPQVEFEEDPGAVRARRAPPRGPRALLPRRLGQLPGRGRGMSAAGAAPASRRRADAEDQRARRGGRGPGRHRPPLPARGPAPRGPEDEPQHGLLPGRDGRPDPPHQAAPGGAVHAA